MKRDSSLIQRFGLGRILPWAASLYLLPVLLSLCASALPQTWLPSMGQAEAAISLVQSKTNTTTTANSITTTFTSTPTQNNLLIAVASVCNFTTNPVTLAGWSVAIDQSTSVNYGQKIFYKIAGASEPSAVTVNWTSVPGGLHIYEYSGIDTSSPLDLTGSANGGPGTAVSSGSVNTAQSDVLVIAGLISANTSNTFSGWTNSFTEANDFNGGNCAYGLADRRNVPAATYTTTATSSSSAFWRGQIATFKAAAGTSISGTVYTDEGVTNIGSGKTVRLLVNGTSVGTGVTNASGQYSISATVNSGDALLAYIDNDGTYKGSTVTVSNGATLSGLHIYAGHVITRHDNGGAMSNALMNTAKGGSGDTDIEWSVSGGDLTVNTYTSPAQNKLYVPAGQTFAPGGNLNVDGVKILGAFTGGAHTYTLAATWEATAGTFTPSTSTLSFFVKASNYYFYPGASTYYNVVFDSHEFFLYLGGSFTASNDVTLKTTGAGFGTFSFSNFNITAANFLWPSSYVMAGTGVVSVSGNWNKTGGGYFGGAINIAFTGGGNSTFTPGSGSHGSVTVNKSSQSAVVSLATNNLVMAGSKALTITSGIFDIAGLNLNIGAGSTFSNDGTLRLQGSETVTNLTNDTDSGTVVYNGAGGYADLKAGNSYYHVTFNGSGSWIHTTLLTVNGNLTITAGTLNSSGQNIALSGNWSNSGTYTSGANTVTLNGTNQSISGTTTFNNLSKSVATARTLSFAAGSTTTINGTATLNGASGQLLSLVSSSPGTRWNFNLGAAATKAISFVNVSDSDASGSDAVKKPVNPTSSTNGGNNVSWFPGSDISGRVFEDADFAGTAANWDGGTNDLGLDNVDVELYSNADAYITSVTSAAGGTFSFPGIADGTYKVRVRAATIGDADTVPKGGLNGTVPGTWPYPIPEMSWGNTTALYGGQSATVDDSATGDNAGPGDNWVSVTVSGGNVTNVNFGFAFNLIVNVDDDGNTDNTRSKQGSLRQFIKNANAIGAAGGTTANSSQFRMQVATNQTDGGGNNWWRITVNTSNLPTIADGGTTLDGSTQRANSGVDSNSLGPEIEIFGNDARSTGLSITEGSNNTVQELVVNSFTSTGISAGGATVSQLAIYGNYLGTNATGSAALANGLYGLYFWNGSHSDIDIGGSGAGQGNLISGNGSHGFNIAGGNTYRIYGNKIGVDRTGTAALANGNIGLQINGPTSGVTLGGPGAGEGNIISKNATYGISIVSSGGDPSNITIQGNTIGSGVTGTESNLGNSWYGIKVSTNHGTPNVVIGGLGTDEGNQIAYNSQGGIISTSTYSTGYDILGNTIHNNTREGILNAWDNVVIAANAIYSNGTGGTKYDGLNLLAGADANKIYHNTLHGNGKNGILVAGTNAVVKNNIITGSVTGYGIDLSGSFTSEAYNLLTDAVTSPANALGQANGFSVDGTDLNADPSYTNTGSGDYTLQNTSPAINRGCDLGAAGDDTDCDDANDDAQPDLTAGANPNFYGFAPELGAFENNSVTSTCNVISTTDGAYGSLRDCITWANANAGTDTINVTAGTHTLTLTGAENANVSGDLDITESVNITGAGMATTIIDGNAGVLNDRILNTIAGAATVTLTDLTLQNANASSWTGAGIYHQGTTLNLTRVAVKNNTTAGHGGGISSVVANTINLTDVELSGNSATGTGNGGGMYAVGPTVTWTGGVASGNSAVSGGAVRSSGVFSATNVTFSGNSATSSGPAINTTVGSVSATLTNVTIYNNTGVPAVRRDGGTVTIKNSIIANNPNGNCFGTIVTAGGNLETVTDTCDFTDGTDQVSVSLANANIDATLSDNGGYTKTHALNSGSYAIDAAVNANCPATDQRGETRGYDGDGTPNSPQTGDCDIGAYERTIAPDYDISGKVFEDAKFAGTAADYVDETDDKALANVDVELYTNADVYVTSTTTDTNGDFTFSGVANGTYKVRVRAATIADSDTTPKGGLNGTVPGTWPYPIPEMTWANGSALYGGQSATADDTDTGDNAGPGDNWVSVSVSGSDVTNVNMGFAYNLIVNVEDDGNADNALSDQGSLRQFIKNANAIGSTGGTTANYSEFRMQVAANQTDGGGNNWWRITMSASPPGFGDAGTILNGARQRLNSGADSNALGPEIELNGNGLVAGLLINGVANVTVQELAINNFSGASGYGVRLTGAGATGGKLYGNYIGTNAIGTAAIANTAGVQLQTNAANNDIGGSGAGEGNVISGNNGSAISVASSATNNRIRGNYLGTNALGTAAVANTAYGISLTASGNSVGGQNPGEGNLISGNSLKGIQITGASNTTIEGNIIGLNAAGTAKVANGDRGIGMDGAAPSNITIGGTAAGAANIISGNSSGGITISSTANTIFIYGNKIGTGPLGTETTLGNGGTAINLSSNHATPNIKIGGLAAGQGNLIAYSGSSGINIGTNGAGVEINGNTIRNNSVRAIALSADGISVAMNLIRNNGFGGMMLFAAGTNAKIYHNTIHASAGDGIQTQAAGTVIKNNVITGNSGYGINLNGGTMTEAYNLVTDNTIATAALRNTSGQSNVALAASSLVADPLYTNLGSNDFNLQAASPAINRGCDLGAAGDDTGCDGAADGAQPAVNGATAGNFNGFAPDLGAFESAENTSCMVSTTADASPTAPYGSLRACINYANANPGTTINFGVGKTDAGYQPDPGDGNRWWRITPVVYLPEIAAANTVVDGTTQTSLLGDTNLLGPEIEIDGTTVGAGGYDGFGVITPANNVTIKGFILNRWSGAGISLFSGTGANTVQGNYIGTNYAGTAALANALYGVYVNTNGNTVGGTTAAARNVIAGNGGPGIYIIGNTNTIQGNYSGVNATAGAVLANSGYGIDVLSSATGNTIGGTAVGAGNVISGNSSDGINHSASGSNAVQGNYLGTNASSAALPNGGAGLSISAGIIDLGNASETQSNIIGPNTGVGINLAGGTVNLAGTVTVNDDVTLTTGTFTLGSATLNVAGNWTRSGATVTPGTSSVVLNGADQSITGDTTFNNLSKSVATARTLSFAAGSTTTINGTATLNGASGQLLNLVSSSPGTRWNFILAASATKAISFVNVSDSDASGSDAGKIPVAPTSSTNGGNNIQWFTFIISGTVYTDEATTLIGDGAVIRLLVNGTSQGTDTTAGGTGTYSITVSSLNSGDALLVYIDGHASKGSTATVSNGADLSGLNIYGGHVIARHDNAGSISNANIKAAKGAYVDTDIEYSVDGSNNLTVSGSAILYVPASHGYTPAANIVTPAMKSLGTFDGGAGTIDVNGALSIGGGSFTATSGTTFVSNNLTISGGTFAHNSGTFSLEPNNKTVNTGAAIFNHVIVNMFNGETLTVTGTMDVNGNLSILGVAAINGTLAVSGNVTTTTFVSGSGIILLDGNTNQTLGASGGVGGIPGLTINNTGAPGAVVTIQDTIDVGGGGAWTYTAGNVNASASTIRFREFSKTISPGSMIFNNVEFNVGSGSTLTISGTLDIDGSLTLTEQSTVNGGVIAVAGNLISTDTTVGGTTAITLDGTGAQSIDTTGGGDLPNGTLMINKAAGTATLAANLTLNGAGQDLTITAGTLDLAGYNPTLTGAGDVLTVDAAGILQLQGGETVTATTKTFNAGSTVIYNGGATYGSLAAGEIYSNLSFNNAAGSWTHTGALDVNGNLTITAGTLLSGGQDVNVAGNWSNSGSYTSGANTVTLDGIGQTVSGDTIFYNLTKSVASADTLTFQAGQTQTLAAGGALSFTGTSGNLLQLRSSSPGTEWFLNVNAGVSPIANYVDVRDSNAAGGQTIYAYYSTDAAPGGTNPNWVFGQQLQLVKQVWDAAGTTCLASIPSDAACNGGATLTNVPAGSAVQFLIFVRNVMAVDAADVRFQDLLDDGAFTFQAGTLKRTPPVIGAPSDVATAAAIFAAANTAQTDAFDGDVSTDEFAGVDTSVSPDNLLIGGNGGVGQNDTLTIPAHKSFGLRFGAVKN